MRLAQTLTAALLLLAASGMPRAWAQTPTWNYYGDTPSAFVPFKDGKHMDVDQPGILMTKLSGSGAAASVDFTMDTGSTGIAISADIYDPDPGGKNSPPGYITYTSSKITEVGYLFPTEVTFHKADDSNTAIAKSVVPVLVVTHVCDGKTGVCSPAKNVSFFGVGFDRPGIQSGTYVEGKPPPPAAPVANANPFLNVTEVGGAPATDLRMGYVITNAKKKDGVDPGVTLGVTSALNSDNYAFTKLIPNTASSAPPAGCPAPCEAWSPMVANVTAGFGGSSATANMSFLPDTGVDHMLFTPPPGTGLTAGQDAPATTTMKISLPGLTGAAVGGLYEFEVDKKPKYDPHNPLVPKLIQVDSGTPFLNAGRTFFGGFDWAYDAVGGFVGYRTNGNADPSYATSNPILSLQGTVVLPSGFGATTYLTDLAGNTILQAGDSATFREVVSGIGSLTVAGGTVVLEAANTFSGGTILTDGTLRLGPGASLASGSALAVDGGTFDLNGNTQTVGTLKGTGGTIMLGSGTLTAGDSGNTTLAAAMTGAGGSFVKQGSGTLTLTAASTYTGGTTVTAGTLQLGPGGALASTGALTISGGWFDLNGFSQTVGALSGTSGAILLGSGTLTAGDATDTTLAAAISGSGAFVKQGSGILTLGAANTYAGGTTVSAGVLQGTTSSLQGNIANNAVVLFNQSTTGTYAGAMSGAGSVRVTGGGIVLLSGANSYSGGTFVSGGTLRGTGSSLQGSITNSDQGSTQFVATATAGAASITNNAAGGTQFFDTSTAGSAVITNNAFGVTLFADSSTAGSAIVTNAVLGNDVGQTSFINTSNAGNATISNAGGFTYFLDASSAGNAGITNTGQSGSVTFAGSSTAGNATLSNAGGHVFFLESSSAGNASLTNTGPTANVSFGSTSTAGSATIVNNDGLVAFVDSSTAGNAAITINGAGRLFFAGTSSAGNAAITANAGGAVDFAGLTSAGMTAGSIAGGGLYELGSKSLTVGSNNLSTEVSGVIAGVGGALVKQGLGTLTLSGANSYSGGTTVNAGILRLVGSLASTGALTVNGGTFDLDGNNQTVGALSGTGGAIALGSGTLTAGNALDTTLAAAVGGNGALVKQGTGTLVLAGTNSYTGGTTVSGGVLQGTTTSLQGNIVDNSVLVFDQSTAGTYAGAISGSGSVGVTGGGIVTFTGANSYAGGTAVSGATLQGNTTSLQGNIANNGTVVFDQAGTGTYAGTMTGTGGLTIQGGGTLILAAAHSYSGGTFVSASTLQGNSANLQGNIVNNGTVIFNQTGTGTYAANMTGTGGLTVAGGGTLIVSGSHSYTGSTTVSGATLVGTTSSLQGGILNNGAVVFDQATNGSYGGGMSGTGSLTKTGTGTVFMTGTNSYGGGTTVSGGILQGTTASLQGNITNNAAVQFHQASDGTFAGSLSGTGLLIKSGAAALTLANPSLHSGGTAILEGTLRIDSTRISGNILDHGALVFDQATLGTYTGNITGNGSLAKNAAGTLILAGSNDYRGGTTVAAGILQGSTDSLRGDIVNNAAVVFDQPAAGTYAGNMSGTGSLTLQGGGLVTLTGNNSFTGGTTLNGGALVANTSSLTGNVTNNGTIVFNQTGSGTYAGIMSGTGGIGVTGGGTVNLTGINTYAGPTTVSNGLLKVNGSITSNVTVGSSGMLGGSGTIFGTVASGGQLSPGNSIGTLTVAGNFTQAAGGSFQAEVNGAGQSDRVNVTGTATLLGGTVNVVVQPSFFAARTTFVLVNAAGGLAGTYASVIKDFNAPFLQPSLAYDANNVYLMLDIGGFQAAAQTATQAAVGRVLDASAATASGDLATVLGNLAAQNSATVLPVLTAISGQNYSSLSTALVQTGQLFMNNFAAVAGSGQGPASRRVTLAEACDVACDSTAPALWGAWGGALGGLGTVGAGSGTGAVTYNAGGFAAGLDRKISPTFTAGAAVGTTTGTQWTGGFTGTSVSDTVQFGLYGLFNQGPVYLDGLAGYAYSSNQMWRSIQVPGLAPRTAIGQTGANQFFGQVETGYRFDLGGATASFVTPFARLQGFTGTQNAFTESGAQSLNLSVAAQTTNSLRSVLGAQVGGAFDMGWRDRLALQFRLGWSHEYADTSRPVTATLGGAPALPFTTYGVSPQRDGALLGFSASTAVAESTSLFLRYESTLSGQDSNHALTAGFRMTW